MDLQLAVFLMVLVAGIFLIAKKYGWEVFSSQRLFPELEIDVNTSTYEQLVQAYGRAELYTQYHRGMMYEELRYRDFVVQLLAEPSDSFYQVESSWCTSRELSQLRTVPNERLRLLISHQNTGFWVRYAQLELSARTRAVQWYSFQRKQNKIKGPRIA